MGLEYSRSWQDRNANGRRQLPDIGRSSFKGVGSQKQIEILILGETA
jgi:hypothetical protein